MKTLRDGFNVRIAAGDVAVEAIELGMGEIKCPCHLYKSDTTLKID